jgi:hypothetical protein
MLAMNPHRVIGSRLFTDGIERPVSEDAAGRQYVLGHDGELVYGQWLTPADVAVLLAEGRQPSQEGRGRERCAAVFA